MAVINLGSINLDYVYRVAHIVRPGETLASDARRTFAGGKGSNQSLALARAGAQVRHVGRVGPEGQWLVAMLARAGVDTRHIACGDAPGGHAIIQVTAAGENAIVLFGGANRAIAETAVDAALAEARPGDLFLTQNETSGVAHAIGRARERGLTVCLNPAPFGPEVLDYPLACVDLFVVNETEAAGLLGAAAWSDDGLEQLAARFPRADWVVTLGARGALCRTAAGRRLEAPAQPVQVVDTTAAGDTFIGYFLACRQRGLELEASLELANRAAGLCVARPGAADSIPTWVELGDEAAPRPPRQEHA